MTIESNLTEQKDINPIRKGFLGKLGGLLGRTSSSATPQTEPEKHRSMSRRSFLKAAGFAGGALGLTWAAEACGVVNFTPTPDKKDPTPTRGPNPESTKVSPTSAESGKFLSADVLSIEQVKSTDTNTGNVLDTAYKQVFDAIKGKPEFSAFDKFSPFVVSVKAEGGQNQNLIFPFFSAEKDGVSKAIIQVDLLTTGDQITGASYNPLIAEEKTALSGSKYSALSLKGQPIFSVPYSQDELSKMDASRRSSISVLFSPYGNTEVNKEATLSGSKLASVISVVTPQVEPTAQPTQKPADQPTQEPTKEPTKEPTQEPTVEPTHDPNMPEVPQDFLDKVAGPLRSVLPSWANVMVPNGGGQIKSASGQNEVTYFDFNFMMYDVWGKDIPLVSATGDTVATSKITAIVCYPKPEGKVDWMLIPLVVENNKGQTIVFSDNLGPKRATPDEVVNFVQVLEDGDWKKGSIHVASISSTPQLAYTDDPGHLFRDTKNVSRDLVLSLTTGKEQTIQNLIDNGDSNDHMPLYPLIVSISLPKATVKLP